MCQSRLTRGSEYLSIEGCVLCTHPMQVDYLSVSHQMEFACPSVPCSRSITSVLRILTMCYNNFSIAELIKIMMHLHLKTLLHKTPYYAHQVESPDLNLTSVSHSPFAYNSEKSEVDRWGCGTNPLLYPPYSGELPYGLCFSPWRWGLPCPATSAWAGKKACSSPGRLWVCRISETRSMGVPQVNVSSYAGRGGV